MYLPLSKCFYFIVFLGTFSYIVLHTFTTVKLPVIKITFEPSDDRDSRQFSFRRPISNDNTNLEKAMSFERKNGKISGEKTNGESLMIPVVTINRKTVNDNKRNLSLKKNTKEDIMTFLEGFKQDLMAENEEDKEAMKSSKDNSVKSETRRADDDGRASLSQLLKEQQVFLRKRNLSSEDPCPDDYKRAGLLTVNKEPVSMNELENSLPDVYKGGVWFPSTCKANRKIAVVIPFRDRQTHLNIFLRQVHKLLQWHLLSYRIFVIEQANKNAFNRGMLMNVGFTEAQKVDNYDCVIFHDVDLIPEDDRNDYSCPSSPRHMSTAVDTMKYRLQYKKLFGGVEGFWTEHLRRINGFPNRYWGWGGEDDDLYIRIVEKNLHLTRPAIKIGRYTMLRHSHPRSDNNPNRHYELRQSRNFVDTDGLNSLRYKVTSRDELALYTLIAVDISPDYR